jgi:hypothetical protein
MKRSFAMTNSTSRTTALSTDQLTAIKLMREAKRSWRVIARDIGVKRDAIRHGLKALGVTYPPLVNGPSRLTLFPNEIQAFVTMRKQGRNLEYIAAEIGIAIGVLKRELRALGFSTARLKSARRAKRGKGFWRSFDEPGWAYQPPRAA